MDDDVAAADRRQHCEYEVERLMRDNVVDTIFEGTNDVNRMVCVSETVRNIYGGKIPFREYLEEIHRDLAAQLDECITQRQTEEEEEDEEDVIVAAGARRGRKKQAVLLTQDTGEDAGEDERAPEKTGDDAPARRGRAASRPCVRGP